MKRIIIIALLSNFQINAQIKFVVPKNETILVLPELFFFDKGNLKSIERGILKDGDYIFSLPKDNGFYLINADNLGNFPLIFNGQDKIELEPALNELKQFEIRIKDSEHIALKAFQEVYQNYLSFLNNSENNLRSNWGVLGQQEAVSIFLKEYIAIKKEMNIRMENLKKVFPKSYISSYISTFLNVPLPENNEKNIVDFFQKNFFNNWNLSNMEALNNPIFINEIKTYLTFFGTKSSSLYDGLNVIMSHKEIVNSSQMKEAIIDILGHELIKMQHPKSEEQIIYLFENFSSTCGNISDIKKFDTTLNLGQRIKNMIVSSKWPNMNLKSLNEEREKNIEVGIKSKRKTLLYFWKSTCDYCITTSEDVENLAYLEKTNLDVLAISLDENKKELITFLNYINKKNRIRPINWLDFWGKESFNHQQLQQIYISGTPLYIILDKNGRIELKTHDFEKIKILFHK